MNTDFAKLTAGLLLAETPGLDDPVVQYGLVGLIAWMVIRECFSVIRMVLDRKARKENGGRSDRDELVRLRAEVNALAGRVARLEGSHK